jgi:hypothetical protein
LIGQNFSQGSDLSELYSIKPHELASEYGPTEHGFVHYDLEVLSGGLAVVRSCIV